MTAIEEGERPPGARFTVSHVLSYRQISRQQEEITSQQIKRRLTLNSATHFERTVWLWWCWWQRQLMAIKIPTGPNLPALTLDPPLANLFQSIWFNTKVIIHTCLKAVLLELLGKLGPGQGWPLPSLYSQLFVIVNYQFKFLMTSLNCECCPGAKRWQCHFLLLFSPKTETKWKVWILRERYRHHRPPLTQQQQHWSPDSSRVGKQRSGKLEN